MPLFGSSHKHDNEGNRLTKNQPSSVNSQDDYAAGNNGSNTLNNNDYNTTGAQQGNLAGNQTGITNDPYATGAGGRATNQTGLGAGGAGASAGYGATSAQTGGLPNDPYEMNAGTGAGAGTGHGHGHHHGNNDTTGKHNGHGKLEAAGAGVVGGLVGSKALHEHSMHKEKEANLAKSHSEQIAEAERLEAQAMKIRENAVASGAHPDNRHLGGIIPGRT